MADLAQKTDVPPRQFAFYAVRSLDFELDCGHQHPSLVEAEVCALEQAKKLRKSVAIWSIEGSRRMVVGPRSRPWKGARALMQKTKGRR